MAMSAMKPKSTSPLKAYSQKLGDLSKARSHYIRALDSRIKDFRRSKIDETNLRIRIAKLRKEKANIKSQVWSAIGAAHKIGNDKNLVAIKCHISCEEKLADDIQFLKAGIANINRALCQITRQIYDLNIRTVPAKRALENVAKVRKRLMMQKNQLEINVRRNCRMSAENGKLREELLNHLATRKIFNDHYLKLIHELDSDKKYMTDLILYAMNHFDASIELYEKFDILKKQVAKETKEKSVEMHSLSRIKAALKNEIDCSKRKNSHRTLTPIQPKEYRRHENLRENLKKELTINIEVLHKIFQYTGANDIKKVINSFKQQESFYYSYFNYAKETSYHMALLNNAVNRLYSNIDELKLENWNTIQAQLEQIQNMKQHLDEKQKSNKELKKILENNDFRLTKLLKGFQLIRNYTQTDSSTLQEIFGGYNEVNLQNLRAQLKLVEKRIIKILAAVYYIEREKKSNNYLVKYLEKFSDHVTELDDIVLTQQCPECAEVDALNIDGTESITILPIEYVGKKLCEKVIQPEMQYRLHSMSTCHFPTARMLTAKRNLELYGNI